MVIQKSIICYTHGIYLCMNESNSTVTVKCFVDVFDNKKLRRKFEV